MGVVNNGINMGCFKVSVFVLSWSFREEIDGN